MSDPRSLSETDEERRARIHREGQEANYLLEHPILKNYFRERTLDLENQLIALPVNAPELDLRGVHLTLKHLHALKTHLLDAVVQANNEMLREQQINRRESENS